MFQNISIEIAHYYQILAIITVSSCAEFGLGHALIEIYQGYK